MEPNQKVKANTPLDSLRSHRFAYIISDKKKKKAQILLILPYLHERRIYLNREKLDTDYFYTSIVTTSQDEHKYH